MNGTGKASQEVEPATAQSAEVTPESAEFTESAGTMPASTAVTPAGAAVTPASTAVTPASTAVTPASAAVTPASTAVTPASTAVTPASTAVTPASAALTPASAAVMPASAAVMPANAAATPRAKRAHRNNLAFGTRDSIARRLVAAQIAIDTILNAPDLQALMEAQGYDSMQMRQGRLLYEQALSLDQQQHAKYGDLYTTTDARGTAYTEAHTTYLRHRKIARVALRKNRGAKEKIGLATRNNGSLATWLLLAQQFYANALADRAIIDALAKYRITQEQLIAAQQLVATVPALAATQEFQKRTAKATTVVRNKALAALNDWMRDFLAIARIALADYPQQLTQLGVGAPS